jgi:hypothetical protein
MVSGVLVSKHIHLDERLATCIRCSRAAFSPWGCTRPSWSFAVLSSIRVVRGGRAGTPSSPYFCRSAAARQVSGLWRSCGLSVGSGHFAEKGSHAIQSAITWWKTYRCRDMYTFAVYAPVLDPVLELIKVLLRA